MKKLLIYYSLSGNGDAVAAYLADRGFDVRKVEPMNQPPKKFFAQILRCGFNAGRKHCEPLRDFDPDVSAYDEIAIGSPVWNGRLSCPVNTVLRDADLSGKRVTFVLYSGSGGASKAEKQIRGRIPNAAILHLREPKKNSETLDRLSSL